MVRELSFRNMASAPIEGQAIYIEPSYDKL